MAAVRCATSTGLRDAGTLPKLTVKQTLGRRDCLFAAARHWQYVWSNAVDPGYAPTKMGGPGAPDDLEMGHLTQTWLAASNDPAARVNGGYWHHRKQQRAS